MMGCAMQCGCMFVCVYISLCMSVCRCAQWMAAGRHGRHGPSAVQTVDDTDNADVTVCRPRAPVVTVLALMLTPTSALDTCARTVHSSTVRYDMVATIWLRFDGRSTACQRSLRSRWRSPLAAVTLTYNCMYLGRSAAAWPWCRSSIGRSAVES